ncbi:hypothetical protein [Abyssalbus ytuae]|uniref:Uncharacterized protein n=1 Tax=Abyssalbus ytuae TaxID=2926907 RepID=A0A9E7CU82_9FLAO|nr:hypothetical protein [Abyssalbus ytuae]UOB17892.1 hypothetical protein MQE35_01015 [Abyssalbus ytuae]
MKKLIALFSISLLFYHCKPVIVNQEVKTATITSLELGNIGLPGRSLLEYKFNTTAIPALDNKIRVQVQPATFNKAKFNIYLKASPANKLNLQYVDSSDSKPRFAELKIIDKAAYINSINKDNEVLNYLKNQQDAKAVTSLSLALPHAQLNLINNAESVFLIYNGQLKKSYLQIADKTGNITPVYFGDGVPFAYSTSGFCWQENENHQAVIADITDAWNPCPSKTYRKASRAVKQQKEINYFKL